MKNDINFCLFCMILKTRKLPRGSTLHQIIPPPKSLTRNPVYYAAYNKKWTTSLFINEQIAIKWRIYNKQTKDFFKRCVYNCLFSVNELS